MLEGIKKIAYTIRENATTHEAAVNEKDIAFDIIRAIPGVQQVACILALTVKTAQYVKFSKNEENREALKEEENVHSFDRELNNQLKKTNLINSEEKRINNHIDFYKELGRIIADYKKENNLDESLPFSSFSELQRKDFLSKLNPQEKAIVKLAKKMEPLRKELNVKEFYSEEEKAEYFKKAMQILIKKEDHKREIGKNILCAIPLFGTGYAIYNGVRDWNNYRNLYKS